MNRPLATITLSESFIDWRLGCVCLVAVLALGLEGCGGAATVTTTPPPSTHTLSVNVSGDGSVSSSPAGISCGTACSALFTTGSTVTLSAAPASGSSFSGWSGACAAAGSETSCTLTMNQAQTAAAAFTLQTTPAAKPTLIGLVTQGDMDWTASASALPQNRLLEANTHPQVYAAVVIQAAWSQLEPQPGVFDDSAIDDALQNIQAYNAKYPSTPVVGKLRAFPGAHSPAWVMEQVGSVDLIDEHTGTELIMPDFWTAQYSVLWTQLQNHLASVYDSNPLLGEVAITSCSSFSGEPFNSGQGGFQDAATLIAAGYTDAQYEQCLTNAAANYAAWTRTPIDFPFNELPLMQTQQYDPSFSLQVMEQFRQTLGTRAVVANEDLNDPLGNNLQPIYSEFQTLYSAAQAATPPEPSPLEFQTLGPTVVWTTVLPFGISTYHPTEIEVWNSTATKEPGGYADITESELQQWSAEIKSSN